VSDEHTRAQEGFSDYLDGTLPAAERSALEQHLAGCAACSKELTDLRQTMSAIKAAPREAPSPEFMDSLREQIRTRSRGRFFGGQRRSYRLEIASLVTLVIALIIYVVLQMVQPLLLVR